MPTRVDEATRAELIVALRESVKLQAHYAELLNVHDGGERIGFDGADAWIVRLAKSGRLRSALNRP